MSSASSISTLTEWYKKLYNTPIEAGRDGREACMGLKIRKVTRVGPPVAQPGIWYEQEDLRDSLLAEVERFQKQGNAHWALRQLENYKTRKTAWEWDLSECTPEELEEGSTKTWYGVVLDEEPESNEFGEVSP